MTAQVLKQLKKWSHCGRRGRNLPAPIFARGQRSLLRQWLCGSDHGGRSRRRQASRDRRSTPTFATRRKSWRRSRRIIPPSSAVIARLPGPKPTREEVETWVQDFARFAAVQRAPTELLVTASAMAHMPAPVQKFGVDFWGCLLRVCRRSRRRFSRIRGWRTPGRWRRCANLGWALCFYTQHGDTPASRAKLAVAAVLFSRFVHGEA